MKRISMFAAVALLALGTKAHAQAPAAKQDSTKKPAAAAHAVKPADKPAAKPADKKADKPKKAKKGKKPADSTAAKKP